MTETPTLASPRWASTRKALHWLLALTILFEVPAGLLMSYTYGPAFKDARIMKLHILASQIHHTVGFLVLAAACIWLVSKFQFGRPPLPATMPGYERALALSAHGCLLLLLVLIPWSGWSALSALEDSVAYGNTHMWFFGTDRMMPRIWKPLPFNDPQGYALFGKLHIWFLITGACILAIHIASALWHHLVRRDGILRRMWPLSS